jgi:hypothetical protein
LGQAVGSAKNPTRAELWKEKAPNAQYRLGLSTVRGAFIAEHLRFQRHSSTLLTATTF